MRHQFEKELQLPKIHSKSTWKTNFYNSDFLIQYLFRWVILIRIRLKVYNVDLFFEFKKVKSKTVGIFGAISSNWIISWGESEFGEWSEISVDATEKQKKGGKRIQKLEIFLYLLLSAKKRLKTFLVLIALIIHD
jgi:hypothetical protein